MHANAEFHALGAATQLSVGYGTLMHPLHERASL